MVAILLGAAAAQADSMFLELRSTSSTTIRGESVDRTHVDWIQIEAFSLRAANAVTTNPTSTGKVNYSALTLTKPIDRSSPLLYLHCAKGTHLAQATLVVRRDGIDDPTGEYYRIKLTEVVVSHVQTSGTSTQGTRPTEELGLTFGAIEFSYTVVGSDGKPGAVVTSSWNVTENRP